MKQATLNVLGTPLIPCSFDPLTGYFRDGCCHTNAQDQGSHVICAKVTQVFLDYSLQQGNDLITPRPEYRFKGLRPGDRWCLCALRWKEAYAAGVSPEVVLESTHIRALEYVTLAQLQSNHQARAQWRWRGKERPPFAEDPKPGQISVWDFPRPPELVRDKREIMILWGKTLVAQTCGAWAVRETSHPPTFYLPISDVNRLLLKPAGRGSFCEWKGPAHYWDLVDGERCLRQVDWSYPKPLPGAESLADCIAFYSHHLACTVDGAPVVPQSGGFYGGWITPDLSGPFKGEPHSSDW